MQLFENSFLEFPITLLRKIVPKVNDYYGGTSRHLDAYEHVWGGIICNLVTALLIQISPWFYLVSAIGFIFHVVVKELIRDRIKHGQFHTVDIITRSYGFLVSLPLLIL